MGEGETTTAEVEGTGVCEIHGEYIGESCPDCVPGSLDAPIVPVEAVTVAEGRKRPRGFAAMDRAKVSEIAANGGVAAHKKGTAHEFTSDEAREAGRKGGRATHAKRKSVAELVDCACGKHGYSWAMAQWVRRAENGRFEVVAGDLECMAGRGPRAFLSK